MPVKNNSNNDNMSFISFPVVPNTKQPAISKWNQLTKRIVIKNSKQNKGLLTGKKAGFIVFDLDHYKNFDDVIGTENPIFKELGMDIIEKLTKLTKTVKTPSGGYHFYFKYNSLFPRNRHSKKLVEHPANFDILSSGGFIMCPPSKIDGKKYESINNNSIVDMPDYLEKYLLEHLDFEEEEETIINDNDIKFVMSPKKLEFVLSKVHKSYLVEYHKWLVITTCVKKLAEGKENEKDYIKVWDEWCKKEPSKYNQKQNLTSYKSCKTDKIDISILFNATKGKVKPFGFVKLFTDMEDVKSDYEVEKTKLGYDFINELKTKFENNNKFLIRSDTGTGKTTSFNHYVKQTKDKFISLVSRQLLGKEQQQNLDKLDIESQFYLDDEYDYGDNIIICADSLLKLDGFDFTDYVIFIDEFNSVIEYILKSSTFIKNHRRIILNIVKNMITNSKFFIGVDADISLLSYSFLKDIIDFKYIVNTKQYFKGTEFVIYKDHQKFIDNLKKEEKFLLCSDSATLIENLNVDIDFHKIIGKNKKGDIVDDNQEEDLEDYNPEDYTSQTKTEFKSLDDFEKVGFSPKIIYGQDSVMERPVYAWFRGNTITPPQYLQQIARNRNPTKIHIIMDRTHSSYPVYDTIQSVNNDIENSLKIYKSEYRNEEEMNEDIYYKSLSQLLYKEDCYNTSKYLYLLSLLEKRGFKFGGYIGKDNKFKFQEEKEQVRNFYKDNFLKHIKMEPMPKYITDVNKILRIPKDKLEEYSELFTDDYKLKEHFSYLKLFNPNVEDNTFIEKIENSNEFISNKLKSIENKILFTKKLMDILNINLQNITLSKFDKIKKYNYPELEKEYKAIVKTSKKKLNFNEPKEIYKAFGYLIRGLIGDCVKSKRITVDKNKIYVYEYNNDKVKYHKELINIKKEYIENMKKQQELINNNDIDFIDEDIDNQL